MAPPLLADFAVPPGCEPATIVDDPRGFGAARFEAAELFALAARLAERGAATLAAIPLDRRIAIWCDSIDALLDPDSEERRRLIRPLLLTSRLSAEGLSEGLRVMLEGAGRAAAEALAERAQGARSRSFAQGARSRSSAQGARLPRATSFDAAGRRPTSLAAVVLAGNVPGLAVQAILPALVLGRPLLAKSASTEPLFAAALVAALARREPSLAEAIAALRFDGADAALGDAAFAQAERVVAYGGAESVGALAEQLGSRLVAHGPKASVALVARETDLVAVGRALARDVALFDQRGCLSVHAVFAEGNGRDVAEALAWGLALEHGRLPPGPIDPATAAAVQQLRGAAELAGTSIGRLDLEQGTVLLEADAAFRPSPGLRTVRVHDLPALERAAAALTAWRGRLQGIAFAGEKAERVASGFAAHGVSRIAPAGSLQEADAAWANGGVDPIEAFG